MKVYKKKFKWGEDWVIDMPYTYLRLRYPHLVSDVSIYPHRWCVKCDDVYAFCECKRNTADKNYPVINVTQLKE